MSYIYIYMRISWYSFFRLVLYRSANPKCLLVSEYRRWNAFYRPKLGAAEIIQGLDNNYYYI